MKAQHRLQIDDSHCRAICDEIGDRLRIALAPGAALPIRLQILLAQLAAQDRELAPSMVPAVADMTRQPETASEIGRAHV